MEKSLRAILRLIMKKEPATLAEARGMLALIRGVCSEALPVPA
jgi:hypothetical protein